MKINDYTDNSIGKRFSLYETNYRTFLDKYKYTVIRLDGRGFSKFTKRFNKPYDDVFIDCMNLAAMSLYNSFDNIHSIFVQSDEITIVFKPASLESNLKFNGRTDKYLSLCASVVTGNFIKYMFIKGQYNERSIYNDKMPEFDARYFQVDTEIEAINALICRQK